MLMAALTSTIKSLGLMVRLMQKADEARERRSRRKTPARRGQSSAEIAPLLKATASRRLWQKVERMRCWCASVLRGWHISIIQAAASCAFTGHSMVQTQLIFVNSTLSVTIPVAEILNRRIQKHLNMPSALDKKIRARNSSCATASKTGRHALKLRGSVATVILEVSQTCTSPAAQNQSSKHR